MLQMGAAEVAMQVVVEAEDSKATAACMEIEGPDQGH